jgi:hypothetical protein
VKKKNRTLAKAFSFNSKVSAKSDVSDIKLSYAIGTHRSGNNVQDWTGMTGNSLTAPVKLKKEHYGIPLFFTIKAKNSQGTEAITECSLKTSGELTLEVFRSEVVFKMSVFQGTTSEPCSPLVIPTAS